MHGTESAAPRLAVLIPAAGASTRLGRPKQLVVVRGEALVRRSARLALGLEPSQVIVVTGAQAPRVAAALAGMPLSIAYNPDHGTGLGSSIATGARRVTAQADGVLVLLCDQWRVTPGDLQRLCRAWAEDPSGAVAARWAGGQGPPAIFPAAQLPALRALGGDRGARHLLHSGACSCRFVAMKRASFDLDTPRDLRLAEDA